MPTVILRIDGPLQSWASPSHWEERNTLPFPTKSGVIGLTANCLGYTREQPLKVLAQCRYAVRADRPGHVMTDEQTAGGGPFPLDALTASTEGIDPTVFRYGVPRKPEPDDSGRLRAPWKETERGTVMIKRQYLADAAFTASLTHPEPDLTQRIWKALNAPARLPALGVRNCPPAYSLAHLYLPDDHGEANPDDACPVWAQNVPLLPNATTNRCEVWAEHPDGEEINAWQPPTSYAARDYTLLAMRRFLTTPPPNVPGAA